MITLTTPKAISTVLGSAATVGYDKFFVELFTFNAVTKVIEARLILTVTSDPDANPITGRLTITPATSRLVFALDQVDILRRVVLTGPQNTSATAIVTNAQNALEAGLVSLGIVLGVQAPGV